MTKLQKRIASAAIMIPPVLFLTYMGGTFFGTLLIALFLLSIHEWRDMSWRTKSPGIFIFLGSLYFIISFGTFYLLRVDEESGLSLTIILLLCVWGSDSLAYLVGRVFKGPKLAPLISPKKTIAGLVGAILGSALVMVLGHMFLNVFHVPHDLMGYLFLGLIGGVLGVVAQAGDLLISMMKRLVAVKDTGTLIPGHGGLLDRIDSLLLVAPVFYFSVVWLVL